MSALDSFAFADGMTTARELSKTITVYSEAKLQSALEAGCKSVLEVMTYLAKRDSENYRKHVLKSRKGARASQAETRRILGYDETRFTITDKGRTMLAQRAGE